MATRFPAHRLCVEPSRRGRAGRLSAHESTVPLVPQYPGLLATDSQRAESFVERLNPQVDAAIRKQPPKKGS
jgi:hypothetical protein